MAGIFNVINDKQIDVINSMLINASDEQRNALVAFGGQMYRNGWMDWSLKFFVCGAVVGAVGVAVGFSVALIEQRKAIKECLETPPTYHRNYSNTPVTLLADYTEKRI